ncbi:MAG: AAA family ATPase [Gordonibacter sp.]|uniref:AAA family ATPase n=1 Tax=Gordonibacter sp. TaxID=1968902 RepID=UPI002FC9DC6E
MDIVALKMTCKNLSNFEGGTLDIDFVTEKRVYSYEIDDNTVEQLAGSVCKLNSIAFAGINATGKTTVLNILSALLQAFVGNDSLKYDARLADYFDKTLEVDTYYFQKSKKLLYRLTSTIRKNDETKELFFEDEVLWSKKITAQTNKKNVFDFAEDDVQLDRKSVQSGFLKKEDSIFSSVMNRYPEANRAVRDMCLTTNYNILSTVSLELIVPFVRYLDPSIEYLRVKEPSEGSAPRLVFEIKFEEQPESLTVELGDLDTYLSSGTIKGISCLSNIALAFEVGGYVVIDEIENHLNKTIVINIMNLFTSKINKKGATLLFSTHYSEILDSFDRGDGIYLLTKAPKIKVRKFSAVALDKDRKDKKRSDLILSGSLDSAPSYQAYRALVDSLYRELWEEAADERA